MFNRFASHKHNNANVNANGDMKLQISDYLKTVLAPITGKKDSTKIKIAIEEKFFIVNITVDESDIGRIIGKQGATIKAIQCLLMAAFIKGKYQLLLDVDCQKEKAFI